MAASCSSAGGDGTVSSAPASGEAPARPASTPSTPALEQLKPRPPSSRPNLIFISTDDQDNGSLNREAMPYLTSEPHGHWWKTDMVYNLSLCCPSRAALLTGQYAHRNGVIDNNHGHLLDDTKTLPVQLRRAGYHTCKSGKYLNFWPFRQPTEAPPGWDDWAAFLERPAGAGGTADGGRDTLHGYYDYSLFVNGKEARFGSAPPDYSTDVLVEHALGCLARAPTDKPFYLDLGFFAPHGPSTPAPRHAAQPVRLPPHAPDFNEEDVSDKPQWLQRTASLTKEQVAMWDSKRAEEYRSLRAVDEGIKTIFAALERMGILDSTVVVFTSDNANAFGEHRFVTKRCYYEECIRFPLWVRFPFPPMAPEGGRDNHLVANVDVAPTLAELAGAELPWKVDGRSLAGWLQGRPPPEWRTAVLLENRGGDRKGGGKTGKYWGLRTPTHTYVELDSGERELYDLRSDPYQLENLAGRPEVAEVQARLATQLEADRSG